MAEHTHHNDISSGPYDAAQSYQAHPISSTYNDSASFQPLSYQPEDDRRQVVSNQSRINRFTPSHAAANNPSEPIMTDDSSRAKESLAQSTKAKKPTTLGSKETRTSGNTLHSSSVGKSPWLPSRWAAALLITVLLEAAVVISMVGVVFGKIQVS
jgi:hypothetical protein